MAQATFLRNPAAPAAAPDEELQAELDALPLDALETRCRRSGVSRRGSRADMVRIMAFHSDRTCRRQGETSFSKRQGFLLAKAGVMAGRVSSAESGLEPGHGFAPNPQWQCSAAYPCMNQHRGRLPH